MQMNEITRQMFLALLFSIKKWKKSVVLADVGGVLNWSIFLVNLKKKLLEFFVMFFLNLNFLKFYFCSNVSGLIRTIEFLHAF